MKLPQDLQVHFPHAALIIASDSVIAKFFLAGGDEIEELDGVAEPREFRQDSEGSFTSSDGSRVAGPDADIDDTPRLKHFIKKMVEHTEHLVREHDIAHIHIAMPAEIEHLFVTALSKDTKAKVTRKLERDLMKEDALEIVTRLFS